MKTGETRDRLLDSVHRRATELARITAPGHPGRLVDHVIARISENLLSTVLMVIGPEFERHWSSKIFDMRAQSHGVCKFCHEQPLVEERGMCQVCWDQVEEDDRQLDRDLAMDEDPKGGIS